MPNFNIIINIVDLLLIITSYLPDNDIFNLATINKNIIKTRNVIPLDNYYKLNNLVCKFNLIKIIIDKNYYKYNFDFNNIKHLRISYYTFIPIFYNIFSNIKTLNLAISSLQDTKEFSDSIKDNTSISKLILSYNFIDNENLRYILKSLSHNNTIKYLDIFRNTFNDDVISDICEFLLNNNSLESIDIAWNGLNEISIQLFIDNIIKKKY